MLKALQHPGRLIPVLFALLLAVGTALLCLPIARANPDEPPNVLAAAFTSVSAGCVTGLAVVDTEHYWSTFGHVVILALIVIGGRSVPYPVQREAVTVALLSAGVVAVGTLGLLLATDYRLAPVFFEVASAFGTTGLSTGITPTLPGVAQLILIALMYIGRVGTVSTASAFALNTSHRRYRLPEERPLIG